MEFAIISPVAGLERYATLSKTHLVLSHIDDPAYWLFYEKRKEVGDFIIVDNGSYEHETPRMHPTRIRRFADVAVLPDFFLQPWRKTWHAAIAFLDEYAEQLPGVEWLYIPQAAKGDINGFIQSYHEAMEDPRISWLGIPRALAYAITNNPLMRVEFARMVRKDHPHIKLHCFGMVNGDIHELGYLAHAGVTSIDSSAPVWRGWHGQSISNRQDREAWDEYGQAVAFDAPDHDPLFTCRIHNNLRECGIDVNTSVESR
jgi:hypothetical protein